MYVNIGHSEDVIAAWQDDARPEDSATFAGDAPQSNARSADAAALETSGISFAAGPAAPAGTMFDSRLSPAPPGAAARAAGALQGAGAQASAVPASLGAAGDTGSAAPRPAVPAPAGFESAGAPSPAAGSPSPGSAGTASGRAAAPAALGIAGTAWGYLESTVDDGRDTSSEAGSDMLVGGASTVARRTARRPGRAGSGQGPAGPAGRAGLPGDPARPAGRAPGGPGAAGVRGAGSTAAAARSAAPATASGAASSGAAAGKAAAGVGRAAAANAGKAAAVGAGKGLAAAAAAVGAPTVALAMAMLAALALCGLVLCMCGAGASSTQARAVGLSEEVQALRPYVSYYMHQEGKGEFVELALAVCQHESGGAGWKIADHDPFQCAESTGASRPGFPDAGTVADPVTGADGDDWWCSASVKQGCAYLSDKLRLWGCDDPCDLEALKNVLQTYNSGPGWHAYALSNGGRWSEDLARSYGIGTPNYPLRVLEHYEVSYGASGDGAAVAEWVKARENKWLVYSQDASLRVDPDRTGATDCSGMCRAAYLAVTGMDIGWYTGDQSLGGKEIASGSRGQGVSASQLEPGDLVFCNFNGYNPTWDHVEMYVGDGQLMGMGHAPGPHYSGDVSSYVANTYNWQVRRYL